MTDIAVDSVLDLLRTSGQEAYLGELVSVAEHSLQAARAAELDDAGPSLVVAALLHDVGWLLRSGSRRHEERGADYLATIFGPAVTEPVRLHVPAKRYLCTIDPDYRSVLSSASRRTLRSQGGLLDEQAREAFAAEPYAGDAIRLRLYDDRAKIPGADVFDLDHYAPLVASLRLR